MDNGKRALIWNFMEISNEDCNIAPRRIRIIFYPVTSWRGEQSLTWIFREIQIYTKGRCGTSWDIVGHRGTSRDIMGHRGTSRDIAGHHGISWDIAGHHGISWDIAGHRRTSQDIMGWHFVGQWILINCETTWDAADIYQYGTLQKHGWLLAWGHRGTSRDADRSAWGFSGT